MELLVVLLKVIFVPLLAVAPELPAKYDDDCYYDDWPPEILEDV